MISAQQISWQFVQQVRTWRFSRLDLKYMPWKTFALTVVPLLRAANSVSASLRARLTGRNSM
jgi:hypothetical protein